MVRYNQARHLILLSGIGFYVDTVMIGLIFYANIYFLIEQ